MVINICKKITVDDKAVTPYIDYLQKSVRRHIKDILAASRNISYNAKVAIANKCILVSTFSLIKQKILKVFEHAKYRFKNTVRIFRDYFEYTSSDDYISNNIWPHQISYKQSIVENCPLYISLIVFPSLRWVGIHTDHIKIPNPYQTMLYK